LHNTLVWVQQLTTATRQPGANLSACRRRFLTAVIIDTSQLRASWFLYYPSIQGYRTFSL